jgi:1,4-alpha-glucan branching enzyme
MKKNLKTVPGNRPQALPVHFELVDPEAQTICIAGTFNNWQPASTPRIALDSGRWAKDLLLSPGTYEYCLVVDGKWMPDKRAKATTPNPYGGLEFGLEG